MSLNHWTGINAAARERFGRALWDLSVDELTDLYRDLGIMPTSAAAAPAAPAQRPHLRIVRDAAPDPHAIATGAAQ